METRSKFLVKLSQQLFPDSLEQEQFIDALIHPQPFHPCILWCQTPPDSLPFAVESPLPWQPDFVDRLAIATRPGQSPLHQQGYYYCLDFSSVFAASVLLTIPTPVRLVVDMCASPGGKSLFAWRSLQPEFLLSNEVIGKRIGSLLSNLKRCTSLTAGTKMAIANLDPKILAQEIPNMADVVVVDAPCTGQSLLAKGEKAPGCFHPVAINKNANRQKRILANSAQVVAPQGYLAYMTCAYSVEENEAVSQWLIDRFPHVQPIPVPHLAPFQSRLAPFPCYRIFPQDRLGAGAFTILFQNTSTATRAIEAQSLSSSFFQRPGLIALGSRIK